VIPAPHTELQRGWKQLRSPGHTTIQFVMQQVGHCGCVVTYRPLIGGRNYVTPTPQFMPVRVIHPCRGRDKGRDKSVTWA
jgi:hypothetical protein